MKKRAIIFTILTIFILLFIEKCSLINLTTADIFKSKELIEAKGLLDTVQSISYEIVPIDGDFPILFDSIKNEFYLANNKGLTKIDAQGNVMFSSDLSKEKNTSVFDFANFTPYVFVENGVYDFSGSKLNYSNFSKILNAKNEMNDFNFKNIFEKYYYDAELVIYETGRYIDFNRETYPMYFKINNEWILLFSQENDYRFTHKLTLDSDDIIGQIDFENFPAKFSNERLMVLKDCKNGIYSTKQVGQKIDDEYLNTYYTQILKEQKLDYQTKNEVKLISRKKDEYHFTGSYWDLPDWVCPSFLNTAYFELIYNNETLLFKEKAVKYYSDFKCKNDLYLYELPKGIRKKNRIAFLDYDLDLGGYMNNSVGSIDPIIKNAGLYMIRPKLKSK